LSEFADAFRRSSVLIESTVNTWTDQAVETRDHVNLMYFSLILHEICFWISVLKSVRLPDICSFDGEVKFKTLINWSPLNKSEMSAMCMHARKLKVFCCPKVNILFI